MPPFQSSSCTATTGCFSISCGTGGSTGPCCSACHSGSRGLQDQHATRKPFLPFTFMGHAHVPAQPSPRTALYWGSHQLRAGAPVLCSQPTTTHHSCFPPAPPPLFFSTGQPGTRTLSLLFSCLQGQGPHSSTSCAGKGT